MTLLVTEEAKQDLSDAYEWYNDQKKGLGNQFFSQFQATCQAIIQTPKGYQSIKGFRQIPVKRFPYLIIYDIIGNKIVVFAVFHTSKDPQKKTQR